MMYNYVVVITITAIICLGHLPFEGQRGWVYDK